MLTALTSSCISSVGHELPLLEPEAPPPPDLAPPSIACFSLAIFSLSEATLKSQKNYLYIQDNEEHCVKPHCGDIGEKL